MQGGQGTFMDFPLPLDRRPISKWCCRSPDHSYDIIEQVGEGTFR